MDTLGDAKNVVEKTQRNIENQLLEFIQQLKVEKIS